MPLPNLARVPDPELQRIVDPVYLLRLAKHYRALSLEVKREALNARSDEGMQKAEQIERAARTAQDRADHIIATRSWWRAVVDRELPSYLKQGTILGICMSLTRRLFHGW